MLKLSLINSIHVGPIVWGATGTFINGQAIVCNDGDTDGECYFYNEMNDTWTLGPSTNMPNFYSAGVLINNDQNWWVSGG